MEQRTNLLKNQSGNNMKLLRRIIPVVLLLTLLLLPLGSVSAQNLRFTLPVYEVEAYLESDGSMTLYYYMKFQNEAGASAIDYIDLGLPYAQYEFKNIEAKVNDQIISGVGNSAYVHGAELPLKNLAIQPGQEGIVTVWVRGITQYLTAYDQPDRQDYVNFMFTPNSFDSAYDKSTNTAYRMTIVLPPGVDGESGVYYQPAGWPGDAQPEASFTTDGRVYYSWYTTNADVHSTYTFGAAFPASAVPASAVITKTDYDNQVDSGGGSTSFWPGLLSNLPCCLFALAVLGFFVFVSIKGKQSMDKRKMAYMPPKISVEGQGIKRGLTAVEAAILMEQPLDKVLTMILFGLIKKEAVSVVEKEPLKIKASEPMPDNLYDYEKGFVKAFLVEEKAARRREIQSTMVDLVKSVSDKMKGFSQKETVAYYKDIITKAWTAVETAQTPEIKSAQYEHTLEWTMLDKEFNDKTERTFTGTPVFVPTWWPRYDPTFRPTYSTGGGAVPTAGPATPSTISGPGSRPSINLPQIPGADFAASMVNGASNMAAGVIGDITGFTRGVTNRTNPIPVSTPSSGGGGFRGGGGGGHSCACACACAGCACACAGGGR